MTNPTTQGLAGEMVEGLEAPAKRIAAAANECCHRSDGFEEYIAEFVRIELAYLVSDAAVGETP